MYVVSTHLWNISSHINYAQAHQLTDFQIIINRTYLSSSLSRSFSISWC